MKRICIAFTATALFLSFVAQASDKAKPGAKNVIAAKYPLLASGVLCKAKPAKLPENVLLRCSGLEFSADSMKMQINQAPPQLRGQYEKYQFYLFENAVRDQLLVLEAKKKGVKVGNADMHSVAETYLQAIAAPAKVSDADVKEFYEANKATIRAQSFEEVEAQLKQYLLDQKKQQLIQKHVCTVGDRLEILVNGAWVEKQADQARDNPVDRARLSGKPSLIVFGANTCPLTRKMAAFIPAMEKAYADKANVVFVLTRKEPILTMRYSISNIPVPIFFDKDGRQIYRNRGFLAQAECEKRLKQMGAE